MTDTQSSFFGDATVPTGNIPAPSSFYPGGRAYQEADPVAAANSASQAAASAAQAAAIVADGDSRYARTALNLADLSNAAAALSNLGANDAGKSVFVASTPTDVRMAANVRGRVNFFDFLQATRSAAVREQIMKGTFTGDLAVEWQAFRDALATIQSAGGRPHGFIPECKIYSSVAPNFAMDYLTLETQGHVRIEAIGAVQGFLIDGMGLGVNGYGVRHLNIGPLCASSVTGNAGIRVRRAHKSQFGGFQSLGGAFAGIWVDGCVTSNFLKPTVSNQAEPFIQTPSIGLYVSGTDGGAGAEPWRALIPSSWCKFDLPVIEYVPIGVALEQTYGNSLIGGTAEGCSNIGLQIASVGLYNKICGTDLEFNTNYDLDVQGNFNELYGVDSQTAAIFRFNALGNKIFGGHWGQITFDSSTKRNLVAGANVNTIVDSSAGTNRNRCSDVTDNAGNWTDRWISTNPTVTAATGSITTATSAGEYKIRDGDTVDFQMQVTITTNGTGAGAVKFDLPFPVAVNKVFNGAEMGITEKSIAGTVAAGASTVFLRFDDGSYPGADGAILIISGTYRR